MLIVDPSDSPAGGGVSHLVGAGGESEALTIRVDTVAPGAPTVPDLLASSDNAGISIDDVTTLQAPAFKGTAEPRSLVRLLANGDVVGTTTAGTTGAREITSEPLGDDVYQITVTSEDAAGNVSGQSPALTTVVAHEVLNLTEAFAATGDVLADLDAQTLTTFPVPGGVVGIHGIPTVNIDAAGNAVSVTGTPEDDKIAFTPTGAESGRLTRAGSSQLLRIQGATGDLTVDPLTGTDAVAIVGTAAADQIDGLVDTTTSLTVGALKTLLLATASTEDMQVAAGLGRDVVTIVALDTTNAHLSVDGADPTAAPKKVGDSLDVVAGSPRPRLSNAPGGPSPGSGVATVSYPQTTGAETRIDYSGIERLRLVR
ncbi:Ig-like domain-containing protein [Nocardioides sp. B-3]|uniref:Ig-like domain-containing protein n=1 Tax=Nocardioides sp. B-3 TaxID=2895565 RepID=UPI002152124E|nr:Ig-like domain-containing protein [Nocardioides sp. B-3]UUZ59122.1 Ig-like domain-containing protein [Nocardioides sp. B-3]